MKMIRKNERRGEMEERERGRVRTINTRPFAKARGGRTLRLSLNRFVVFLIPSVEMLKDKQKKKKGKKKSKRREEKKKRGAEERSRKKKEERRRVPVVFVARSITPATGLTATPTTPTTKVNALQLIINEKEKKKKKRKRRRGDEKETGRVIRSTNLAPHP